VSEPAPAPPRLRPSGADSAARFLHALPQLLAVLRDGYLARQRWFGDKTRRIVAVAAGDLALIAHDADHYLLLIADVAFAEGEPARYFVPLALAAAPPADAAPLATLIARGHEVAIVDAFRVARFRAWLLRQLAEERELPAQTGRFAWRHTPALADYLAAAQAGPSRVAGGEQSNTSVVYDDAIVVKAFRKLQRGVNPEVELDRFLTAHTPFRQVPLLLGDAAYLDAAGAPTSLAIAQNLVPSLADGWTFTLDALAVIAAAARQADAAQVIARTTAYAGAARRLGERTGQLHMVLASDTTDPALAPEPISEADVAAWSDATRAALASTTAMLQDRASILPADLAPLVREINGRVAELAQRALGFRDLAGVGKIRVHGDYHLGQTLRTPTDDWVILDFEGEPARSLAERAAKTSPLKDVAGMLRSFAYARGAALRSLAPVQRGAAVASALATWEGQTREAFLAGYRAATLARGASFLPSDPVAFTAALAAWELDKAVYELAYELNNRPDWVEIPLAALGDRGEGRGERG